MSCTGRSNQSSKWLDRDSQVQDVYSICPFCSCQPIWFHIPEPVFNSQRQPYVAFQSTIARPAFNLTFNTISKVLNNQPCIFRLQSHSNEHIIKKSYPIEWITVHGLQVLKQNVDLITCQLFYQECLIDIYTGFLCTKSVQLDIVLVLATFPPVFGSVPRICGLIPLVWCWFLPTVSGFVRFSSYTRSVLSWVLLSVNKNKWMQLLKILRGLQFLEVLQKYALKSGKKLGLSWQEHNSLTFPDKKYQIPWLSRRIFSPIFHDFPDGCNSEPCSTIAIKPCLCSCVAFLASKIKFKCITAIVAHHWLYRRIPG